MYNLHLSPEQLEIRDTVRDFVAHEVKPARSTPHRLETPARPLLMDVLDKASQMGLRTLALSEERAAPAPTRSPAASSPRSWRSATPTSPPCWRRPRRSPACCSTAR